MTCRHCGTEIAEKALICFRCGTATTEARVPQPRAGGPARSRGPVLLAVIVLAVSALVMGQVATDQVPREVGYGLAVLGLVAIGWHLAQRRG